MPHSLHLPAHRAYLGELHHGRRTLTFGSKLFHQPTGFRARVIVEELLHLKVPNHGKLFKALLRSYLAEGR